MRSQSDRDLLPNDKMYNETHRKVYLQEFVLETDVTTVCSVCSGA